MSQTNTDETYYTSHSILFSLLCSSVISVSQKPVLIFLICESSLFIRLYIGKKSRNKNDD